MVLDSGDGVTHAVPVYEGFSMPMAIRRIDVAGRDVTDALQTHLRKAGYNLHTSAEKEVVRTIKEKCCFLSMNPAKEEQMIKEMEEFRLPDGNSIKLGAERFRAPEILFNPELHGLEYPGIPQIIVDSISRADLDMRQGLYQSIVLSGGTTLMKGFGDRLLYETKRLVRAGDELKIKIWAPPERKYSTWIGGSILAGLNTFKKVSLIRRGKVVLMVITNLSFFFVLQMWVSAEEYNEDPNIIHKKVS